MTSIYGFKDMSDEEMAKFNTIFDIAITIRDRNKKRRAEKMRKLVDYGRLTIRPMLYSLRCYYANDESTDEQIEEMEEKIGTVMLKIGINAIPILVEEAYNGSILTSLNDFAVFMIWKICKENDISPINKLREEELYDFDYYSWYKSEYGYLSMDS